jgi:hypothetical protein
VSALALADSVALAGSATALPPHRQAQAQAAANASVLRRGSRPSAATSAAGLPHLPAPAIAAGGAAARALQQVQAVGFPADALQWLRDIQFPLVNGASTIDVLPARVGEQLGSCYALCRVLQAGAAAPDSFGLGRKLSALLPRLLLGPHGRTREAASRAVRRRCLLFCECSWAQLWGEMPVPPTPAQQLARQQSRDHQRGFTRDDNFEGAVRAVADGRLSSGLQRLLSAGVASNVAAAWAFIRSIHFRPPAVDPLRLSATEQADYAAAPAPDPVFLQTVRTKLLDLLQTSPKGVGAGPSGERYEHLKAVAESSMGCDALLDLCMQLVTGHWCPSDRAARLIALVKDVGFRPITMGESRRRRVGRAILQSLGSSVEDVMLPAHQLAFTADGCQIVYNLLRHTLTAHPTCPEPLSRRGTSGSPCA